MVESDELVFTNLCNNPFYYISLFISDVLFVCICIGPINLKNHLCIRSNPFCSEYKSFNLANHKLTSVKSTLSTRPTPSAF